MSDFNRLTTASDVIDALGGTKKMAELLGVGAAAVSNYRTKGFPASKYLHIDQLCTENGLNVADAVFGNQRGAADTQAAAMATIGNNIDTAVSELLNEGFTQLPSLPILQPAAPFINRIGTSMQQRLYILTAPSGERLCLRPDLTIPSALYYLKTDQTGEARYFYQGTAFRYQSRGSGLPEEFTQMGLEIIGGTDEKTDDAKILRHILIFIKNLGIDIKICKMTIVDCRHYINRVNQYKFSEAVATDLKQRLNANTGAISDLEETLGIFANNTPSNNITTLPPEATDIIGRTGDVITARLKAKKRAAEIAKNDRDKLHKFINDWKRDIKNTQQKGSHIHGELSDYELNLFETACEMGMVKENIFRRPTHMQKMAYYTGIYFEITVPSLGDEKPIARGGRYDDLLQSLGTKNPIPAVGGAITLERLLKAVITK